MMAIKETTQTVKTAQAVKAPVAEAKRNVVHGKSDKSMPSRVVTKEVKRVEKDMKKGKKKRGKGLKSLWVKEIGLMVINVGLIMATLFLLRQLPIRAKEFKQVRNASISTGTKSKTEIAGLEIEASKEKADKLSDIFPDEGGLIGFVREVDILKEEGLVTRFAFASDKAVRDSTGNFGIPVIIEFRGTWAQVGQGLSRLNEIPFLLRAISIEAERGGEENLVVFKYGGFLYVDPTLAEN